MQFGHFCHGLVYDREYTSCMLCGEELSLCLPLHAVEIVIPHQLNSKDPKHCSKQPKPVQNNRYNRSQVQVLLWPLQWHVSTPFFVCWSALSSSLVPPEGTRKHHPRFILSWPKLSRFHTFSPVATMDFNELLISH